MVLTIRLLSATLWCFGEVVSCQRISEVLSSQPQLSSLATQLEAFPSLAQQFDNADNFTFLAPSNNAITAWLTAIRSQDYIRATLEYHFLNGTYPIASLSNTPQFIPTSLTNASYANVTGGQRVEALNDGHARFISGLNTSSKIINSDIPATGGLVQIIDTVLDIPFGSIETATDLNLSYFVELGNEVGFLSLENGPEVSKFTDTPNLTWFAPNSAQALAHANVTGINATLLGYLFDYQCIAQLIYSTGFVNGTQLTTVAGPPVLVTVKDSDIFINNAKITARDNLVVNGVFHVLDDVLNPQNIIGPSFSANNSTNNIPPAAKPPVSSEIPSSASSSLPTGEKVGIVVGSGTGVLGMIFALILIWRRKKRKVSNAITHGSQEDWSWNTSMDPVELSSNPLHPAEMSTNELHELAQLETKEHPIELPAKQEYLYEIGRAF